MAIHAIPLGLDRRARHLPLHADQPQAGQPSMMRNSEVMEMHVEQGKPSGAPDRTAVVVVAVALVLQLVSLLGGGMMIGPGMMVAGPLFVVSAVLLMAWIVAGERLPATVTIYGGSGNDAAQAILRERYARGELPLEQYEQMRPELSLARVPVAHPGPRGEQFRVHARPEDGIMTPVPRLGSEESASSRYESPDGPGAT